MPQGHKVGRSPLILASSWHKHEGHPTSHSVFGFRDALGISPPSCATHPNKSSHLSPPLCQDLISPCAIRQTLSAVTVGMGWHQELSTQAVVMVSLQSGEGVGQVGVLQGVKVFPGDCVDCARSTGVCVLSGSGSAGDSDICDEAGECWGFRYLSWNSDVCVNRRICVGCGQGHQALLLGWCQL